MMTKVLNTVEHQQMLALRDELLAALTEAMQERHTLNYQEDSVYGSEPMWVIHERLVMADAVGRHQAKAGLPAAPYDQIRAVEQSVAGHSDYGPKYALRLAMLAFGLEWKP